MRTCHYQDRPAKSSLCLRSIDVEGQSSLRSVRWTFCDGGDDCPHRAWDQERRTKVTKARSDILGICGVCGRRHDHVIEHLTCLADSEVEKAIGDNRPAVGSKEPLLEGWFPRRLKERAWRKVRASVISRDGAVCKDCGRDLREYPSWYTEVHHIIAVIDGGGDHPSNLVTLCVECHGAYTDDTCRQLTEGRPGTGGEGSSHRMRRRISQKVLDDGMEED